MKKVLKGIIDPLNVLLFAIFVSIICIAVSSYGVPHYRSFSNADNNDFSSGWTTLSGEAVSLTSLDEVSLNENNCIVLTKKLPFPLHEGFSLNFRSKNMNFEVRVNTKELYSFYPQNGIMSGRSSGSSFHSIFMDSSDAGLPLYLYIYPLYQNDGGSFIDEMVLEPSGIYYQHFLESHFIPFMLCLIVVIIGLVLLAASFVLRRKFVSTKWVASIAFFAICVGTWAGLETLFLQMLTGSLTLIHSINYLLLIIMPYPAVQLVNCLLQKPQKRYMNFACILVLIELVLCYTLNFLKIYDMHECLPIVHTCIGIGMGEIIYMFIKDFSFCKWNHLKPKDPYSIIGFFILFIFTTAEIVIFWISNENTTDSGVLLSAGLLIFIVFAAIGAMSHVVEQLRLARQTEVMKVLAFKDSLTGIPNRTAYTKMLGELRQDLKKNSKCRILVCQMDVDHLKPANDMYGHEYGDQLLRSAAEIIERAFESSGFYYRTGGDEFAAFIESENAENDYIQCFNKLNDYIEQYNKLPDTRIPISISCGTAVCGGETSLSLGMALQEADKNMYEAKRKKEHRKEYMPE